MADGSGPTSRSQIVQRLALMTVATLIYVLMPISQDEKPRPVGHFSQLARAFLEGRLSIDAERGRIGELIPGKDPNRLYCPYPPLPAILLMPFVLVTHVKVELACRLISVVNVWLIYACLHRLPKKFGRPALTEKSRIVLTLFFAFGTVAWHNAKMGGDWHLAHAVAMCAMLLALCEYTRSNRALVIGCFVGLAMLSRPTAALTGLFFALPLLKKNQLAEIAKLSIGPVIALVLLGTYNAARFGTATDFGYERMLLQGEGQRLMAAYGQFDQAFLLRNVFWFFLAPPWLRTDGGFPWLGYDPHGLSLFLASPALLYVFAALRREWKQPGVKSAALSIVVCLVPLLMYFNTGYWQFGHRFSMDYLPMLIVLTVAGTGPRPSRTAYGLILLSIGVQTWGVMFDSVAPLPSWLPPSI
ncbi:MAG: glycosyltransferase 87 family protein [Phycisphaerales bacterium]|nr:glycosyltransferase 87 family protein [Phycisphaerales bacterium]